MILIPENPIVIKHPKEDATEYEKFANNGQWFLDYARWIMLNYYNTYSIPTNYVTQTASGVVNSAGGNVSTTPSHRVVDEMLENYDYYNTNQQNLIFNHLTLSPSGQSLPNIWIRGGEIRSMCDHILGKVIKQIEPIEKTISADSISENSLLKRQEIFDKIDLGANAAAVLNELGGGDVQFKPVDGVDYSNPSSVKEAKLKVRGEYENEATIISRSAYYKNRMEDMFKQSALDTIVGNLAGIEFTEANGDLRANYIPCYSSIYDFSTWGEFGEGQTKAGYIIPVTLEEILQEYPNMSAQWVKEIQDVLYSNVDGSANFMDYWNQPFQNVKHWYNDQKWVSKAVVYWITKSNIRTKKKENQFGGKRIQKLDDQKIYQIDTGRKDENGNKIFDSKKGHELKGDTDVWMIHKAVVIGNKYLLEYGYDTYQVRPFGDKRKPEIPIKWICQGKVAGYVKPIVSRLKPKQDELDAVRYRIREYMSQDMGKNYIFNGAKLGEELTAKDIVNDFKTFHVTVLPPTGDGQTDKMGISDLVRSEDMTNHTFVREYIALKNDILKEMYDILGVSEVSLGEQSSVIGKGVQQETINRSELSGLNLYHSLNEFWRRCIQFAANKYKMILIEQEDKNVVLPVSSREVKILKLTKEFRFEDLNVYLSPDDAITAEHTMLLKQMLHAYSINPKQESVEAILNGLKLMRFKSFGEGIALLEDFVVKQRAEDEKKMMREQQTQMQMKAYQNHSDQLDQQQAEIAKLTSKLAEIQMKGLVAQKTEEVKQQHAKVSKLDDVVLEQISSLIAQQLQGLQPNQQPQGQPQQ